RRRRIQIASPHCGARHCSPVSLTPRDSSTRSNGQPPSVSRGPPGIRSASDGSISRGGARASPPSCAKSVSTIGSSPRRTEDDPGDTTLWRMSHFVDEITRLREALGLRAVHLYGHSWGTNVAVDYMLRKPAGVRSVTLAGALLDATRYHDDVAPLVAALPDSVQSALIVNERN